MHVSALHVYPIKSCRGLSLDSAVLGATGLEHDREWMIARPDGVFLSQRVLPAMTLIEAEVTATHLQVHAPDMPELLVPLENNHRVTHPANVWKSNFDAWDEGEKAAEWFSSFLGRPCKLLRSKGQRLTSEQHHVDGAHNLVHCPDGYPLLVTSTATLQLLEQHAGFPIPMDRFRPNVVVSGDELSPGAEDFWQECNIGDAVVRVIKACARCPIPDIDQQTGERKRDVKPVLEALRFGYRNGRAETFFGQNAVHLNLDPVTIHVGDQVHITRTRFVEGVMDAPIGH